MFKTINAILVMVLFASVASAQSFVSGIVTDGANGEALQKNRKGYNLTTEHSA